MTETVTIDRPPVASRPRTAICKPATGQRVGISASTSIAAGPTSASPS